jgi:hypothetical protein
MGIRTSKITQTFTCNGCGDTWEYNQPTSPAETLPVEITDKLKKLVATSDPASGNPPYEAIFCDDECAIQGIRDGKHRKTVQLVVGAKPGDFERATVGDAAAKRMKRSIN